MAGGGAPGPGRRRALVRAREHRQEQALRPLLRHAQPGVLRRRGRGAHDDSGRQGDAAARSSRYARQGRDDVLLLVLRRAHRVERGRLRGRSAVPAGARRPLGHALAVSPLGATVVHRGDARPGVRPLGPRRRRRRSSRPRRAARSRSRSSRRRRASAPATRRRRAGHARPSLDGVPARRPSRRHDRRRRRRPGAPVVVSGVARDVDVAAAREARRAAGAWLPSVKLDARTGRGVRRHGAAEADRRPTGSSPTGRSARR